MSAGLRSQPHPLVIPDLPLPKRQRQLLLNKAVRLPLRDLNREGIRTEAFRVGSKGSLAVYWAPTAPTVRTDYAVKILIVGITPGWSQTLKAYEMVRAARRENPQLSYANACRRANREAAFGKLRPLICARLDLLHVNDALGLESCQSLFTDDSDLLAVTSAIRYPAFINGDNFRGDRGSLIRHPLLRPFIDKLLARDVRRVPNALIVPLGSAVSGALEYLIDNHDLDPNRVLLDFPHPSGENQRGQAQWRSNRRQLQHRVDRWHPR
jgi:hypothetical protein